MSPLTEAILFCLNHIAKRGGDASVCSEAREQIAKLEAADPSNAGLRNIIDDSLKRIEARRAAAAEKSTSAVAVDTVAESNKITREALKSMIMQSLENCSSYISSSESSVKIDGEINVDDLSGLILDTVHCQTLGR